MQSEYAKLYNAMQEHHYGVWIEYNEEDKTYLAMIPDLPDCVGGGESPREALDALYSIEEYRIKQYLDQGVKLPEATKTNVVRKLYIKHEPDKGLDLEQYNTRFLYPAVFQKKGKAYNVIFPDFDRCYTCGDDLTDAFCMAEDALIITVMDFIRENRGFPTPSKIEDLNLQPGEEAHYVFTDLRAYLENAGG